MLQPARRKYRKEQKGRNKGVATRGAKVSFGDYGFSEAHTTYGVIGIKVWVFKGEVMAHNAEPAQAPAPAPEATKRPRRTPRELPAGAGPGAKNAAAS